MLNDKFQILELILITNILKESGFQVRLVGGCVRDAYLGLDFEDIDIITDALPQETISLLSSYSHIKVKELGLNYGSILVIVNNKKFEITTLRKDVENYGRYAKVIFTKDFEEDAERRDFTINALSYDLEQQKIYDYFNGLQDLQERKVRFIGSPTERVEEDYLRILRFFRFSSKYADSIDEEGFKACILHKANLNSLSSERIKSEFEKIIISPNALYIISLMHKNSFFEYIFPMLQIDIETFNYGVEFQKKSNEFEVRLASLLGKNSLTTVKEALVYRKFSNKELKLITNIISYIQTPIENREFHLKKLKSEKPEELKSYIWGEIIRNKLTQEEIKELIDYTEKLEVKKMPFTGRDLIKLNLDPIKFSFILNSLQNEWIKSNFSLDKKELINIALNNK